MSLTGIEKELPEGLLMRMGMDMNAMTNFVNMPDANKRQLINYIQSSTTGDEARNRVDEVINYLK